MFFSRKDGNKIDTNFIKNEYGIEFLRESKKMNNFALAKNREDAPVFLRAEGSAQQLCPCGNEFEYAEQNFVEFFHCTKCGNSERPRKELESPQENTAHLIMVKSKITALVVAKLHPFFEKMGARIDNNVLEQILTLYFDLKKVKSHRTVRLVGDLAACAAYVLKLSKQDASRYFAVEQKYVSGGMGLISRTIINFKTFDFDAIVSMLVAKIAAVALGPLQKSDYAKIVGIISIAKRYGIGRTIPVRTRVIGAIWIFIKSQPALDKKISDKFFIKTVGMQKETFTKFFKEFVLAIHCDGRIDGKFNAKIKHRKKAFLKFLDENEMNVPEIRPDLKIIADYRLKYILNF